MLYAGERTGHRSCGVALAETFGRPVAAYQALRRGGITGTGPCGAVTAGRLLLGEFLADPDPTAPAPARLVQAVRAYEKLVEERVDRGGVDGWVCNDLTARFEDFRSRARHRFCTRLVADVAECVAEVLSAHGVDVVPTAVDLDGGGRFDPVGDGPPPEAAGLDEATLPVASTEAGGEPTKR